MHSMTFLTGAALVAGLAIAMALPSAASEPVASPLIVQPVATIQPVASADGSIHLAYELLLINQSAHAVTVNSIAVIDESGGTLADLDGAELAAISRLSMVGGSAETLQPSQSSFVFFDVVLPAGAAVPKSLSHRILTSQSAPAEAGSINLGGLTVAPATGALPDIIFTAAPVAVSADPAVVLVSPVHGDGWIVFRGCCDVMSSHRGNTGIYDGEVRIAERFAIDFVKMDDTGRMIVGTGNEISSYVYYGEPIYAVADGVVVSARNDQPTQVPGALPTDVSSQFAGGNAVTIDIGHGRFAFYAHMQPGSLRVEAGDIVKAGQVIGLLGNSGMTLGPHLHFHVTDHPSPLDADGMPFVFAAFEGKGVLTPEAFGLAMQGKAAPVEEEKLAGPHRNVMPTNSQLIDFGN